MKYNVTLIFWRQQVWLAS